MLSGFGEFFGNEVLALSRNKIMNKLEKYLKLAPCDYYDKHEVFGNHIYLSKADGKLWPGATTILKQWGGEKTNIFIASSAKKAVMELGYFDSEKWIDGKYYPIPKEELKADNKRFNALFKKIKSSTAKEYYALLKQAKGAFFRKSKEASDSGTLAHDYIENHICERKQPKELVLKMNKDAKAKSSVKAFDKWEKENKVDWVASELVIGSAEYEFGGKLDAIAYVNNIPSLIDFKTSNQISADYFLQTAAYQIALEEMGFTPLQRIILRIPKDGGEFETATIPNNLENGNRLELDKSGFLALRQVQRVDSYYNNENHNIKVNGKIKLDNQNGNN